MHKLQNHMVGNWFKAESKKHKQSIVSKNIPDTKVGRNWDNLSSDEDHHHLWKIEVDFFFFFERKMDIGIELNTYLYTRGTIKYSCGPTIPVPNF